MVVKAEGKLVHPSWPHLTCCLPTMQVGTQQSIAKPSTPHSAAAALQLLRGS